MQEIPFEKIANPLDLYVTRDLVERYLSLKKKPDRSLSEMQTLLYLSARMNDRPEEIRLLSVLSKRDGTGDFLWRFMDFRARYQNAVMGEALERLAAGKMIPSSFLSGHDALGLTTFHYAVLLGNKETVEKILSGEDPARSPDCRIPDAAERFFSESFFAYSFLKAEDPELSEKTMIRFSPSLRSLKHSLESMGFHVDAAIMASRKLLSELKEARDAGDMKETEILRKKISENADRLEELEKEEEELRAGLGKMLSVHKEREEEALRRMKASEDPLLSVLFRIAEHPDSLYEIQACALTDRKLCRLGNLFFVLPSDWKEAESFSGVFFSGERMIGKDLRTKEDGLYSPDPVEESLLRAETESRRRSEKKKRDEEQKRTRRKRSKAAAGEESAGKAQEIEEKWFSLRAHYDEIELKKEYHALVKRYHPDVTGADDTEETLREIMEERERILRSLHG